MIKSMNKDVKLINENIIKNKIDNKDENKSEIKQIIQFSIFV